MIRRLLATYVTITAVALLVLVVPLGLTFARSERDRLYFDIERDAGAIASLAEDALEAHTAPALGDVLADYRRRTDGRIVVVDQDGISVADSDNPDATARDYSTRPEIIDALDGRRAIGTRPSETLGGGLVYVAVPVASGGVVHGAVRVTFPTAALDARVRNVWLRLGGLSVLVLGLVTAVGLLLARGVTRPVRALDEAAERIAGGELDARVQIDRGPPELRRLATTFNRTAARLEHLVTAQERFVADAAHQLRTPLTALRLRLENFESHLPGAEQPKLAATIDEVQRLSRIVDGLLLLARRDADEPALHPVDLARATADRVDAWTDTAAAQGVELGADLPDHLWVVAPDDAVEQILDNLVANAVAASPPAGAITVSVVARPGVGELHVVDQGPGLSATDREQAFDRFWRGTTTTPGTGLGLSIVRELVRLAGGSAALASGPGGRGIDAVIRLPLAQPPVPASRERTGATSLTQR